jgi:excisionase family DNA binding protein
MTSERPNETAERLWTVRDVAAFLQASTSYVYKAAERGEVPCRRVGALLRFVPAEIRAWVLGGLAVGARAGSAAGSTP